MRHCPRPIQVGEFEVAISGEIWVAIMDLGLKGKPVQAFGHLLQQAVSSNEAFRLLVVSEKLVDQFIAYGHGSSFSMFPASCNLTVYTKFRTPSSTGSAQSVNH